MRNKRGNKEIHSEAWSLGYGRINQSNLNREQSLSVEVSEDKMREQRWPNICCASCVCVCVGYLAGEMSLRVCSVLPSTSGASMMPCLSLFKHTQTDQMKDKRARRTSLSAFLAQRNRVRATLIKHTRAHGARGPRGEGKGRCRRLIDSDTSHQDTLRPCKGMTAGCENGKRNKSLNQPLVSFFN